MTTLQLYVTSPVEAHAALNGLYQGAIKPHTQQHGAGVITWETSNAYLRKKMRGAFHGYILQAFSEQKWFTDPKTGLQFRYSKEAWKEYLKGQFLEPKMQEYLVKRTGELKIRKLRPSTEELSDDEYALFMTKVQAFGIVDLGIEFPEEDH